MANQSIKDVIRDFVNFDVENDYYQDENKEEIVRMFKQIMYEDDVTVRKFLKSFFKNTKDLAKQYSLVAGEGEVEEIPTEEPEDDGEEIEEEPAVTPESVKDFYRKAASNILYE